MSYSNLDDVPIERIYFTSGGNYRCFDGSSTISTLMIEIPPVYGDNP